MPTFLLQGICCIMKTHKTHLHFALAPMYNQQLWLITACLQSWRAEVSLDSLLMSSRVKDIRPTTTCK